MVAGLEHLDVGLAELRLLRELLVDPPDLALGLAAVHPEHQAEREEVLGAALLLVRQLAGLERGHRQVVDVDRVNLVLVEAAVLERVRRVARLLEVGLDERAGVDDQRAVVDQILEVGLERRRVHRDQHVGRVTRRVDLRRREVELEARDAEQAAGGCADLGREVGERRDVVAGFRRGLRELGSGELHAVAGVADEPDHDPVQVLRIHRDLSRSPSSEVARTLPAMAAEPKRGSHAVHTTLFCKLGSLARRTEIASHRATGPPDAGLVPGTNRSHPATLPPCTESPSHRSASPARSPAATRPARAAPTPPLQPLRRAPPGR